MSPKKLEYVSKKKVRKCLQKNWNSEFVSKKKTLICLQKKKESNKKNPSLWELLKIRNKQAAHTGA